MRTAARLLCMVIIASIGWFAPTPAKAATPPWQDLPDNLFDRMACFDSSNADVIWTTDGNAYAWKTSTQLTSYTTPSARGMGSQWCSEDGYFYNTEYTIVRDQTTNDDNYVNLTLVRRSLTQAPTTVTTLRSAFVDNQTDVTGAMSIVSRTKNTLTTLRSSDGTNWSTQTYTFVEPIADIIITQHNASQLYVITMPQTWYRTDETLPRNRTISQFTVWKSSDAGRTWRSQARVTLPQSCPIVVLPQTNDIDNTTCYRMWLTIQFVQTPTRYTSPDAVAIKLTYVKNGLITGKTIFSADSGRTWQDVQPIQGTSSDTHQPFFNDSDYPSRMYRPVPELIYTPSSIFFSAYVSQHLQTTHAYDPISDSITRAPAMETTNQRTWYPLSVRLSTRCEDTNNPLGNQVVTVATLPTVRICKNNDGIAYWDSGNWQWQQISADNPHAQLIAVSDTLPLTIVRQRCQPSPTYGRYPTLDCTTMQYLQVAPRKAVTTPVTLTTPLAIPYERTTQHTIDPRFKTYWDAHGGLAQFGYPISEPFNEGAEDGTTLLVQYFERNRFEWHPNQRGTPYEVQLGLIGNYFGAKAQLAQPGPFARQNGDTEPGQIYFAETGHTLRNAFKRHWQGTGGLAQYGYPISEEFFEVNPADGQTYVVQYFERARFEWHPDNIGTPYEVLLGLLGNQLLVEKGWN